MATFLPPVEKPRGLIMKIVYAMSRRQQHIAVRMLVRSAHLV